MPIHSWNPALNQPKPPPQTLQPDDERKIQIFLERASSIVLERPVLDLAHWRRLVSLAEELGLTDTELKSTVDDLRQRGVISEIDLSPPKPPPLPSKRGKSPPAAPPQSGPEQDFSLTPPAPPSPPSAKAKPQLDKDSGSAPPAPFDLRTTQQPDVTTVNDERLERYLNRARSIIGEQRGFGARTQVLLTTAAEEMGITEVDATAAIESLNRSSTLPSPPPPPDDRSDGMPAGMDAESDESLKDQRRWRVEGAPPPEPPPPSRKPEAIYRDYLSASLAQITDGKVPVLLERKFVKHGTSVLGLAKTFAHHLVKEEAAEKGLRFEAARTDPDLASGNTAVDASDDELCDANVELFLTNSVPILALHRGINAKSRVLLNALAAELGLSEEQVERAIATTQFRTATTREDADALQEERLAGFRELVRGALISLPRKLLTFDVEENLCRHGEERHGIKPELVASAVREVCQALDIRQISERQAREHIEQLVDAKLVDNARLPIDTWTRFESEGKQWGLSSDQVTAIIKERTQLQDKRNRSERNFTHGALFAASIAGLIVLGFFGWVAIQSNAAKLPVAEFVAEPSNLPAPIVVDESNVDTSWWGEELQFAVSAARREMRSLRPDLIRIESKEPNERGSGYGQLVKEIFDRELESEQRDLLMRVLSFCYARDPDDDAARQVLDGLITRIPRSERNLRSDDELYANSFVATQAAIALVTAATDNRERDAAAELGRAIGRTIDPGLDPPALQQHAFEGVAERLYRLLIALARSEPALVASSHATVAQQAARYIDPSKLEKLNADFLVVVLAGAGHMWREYEDLIRATVASKSPILVVRMLEIYEKTKEAELQKVLAELLIERIDDAPESRDVVSIANAVRKSLGVLPEGVDNKRLTGFLVGAKSLLEGPRAEVREPEALLLEIVNLAHHSTLGCAVAQGSSADATFDSLAEQDPETFLTSDRPAEPPEVDEPKVLDASGLRMLNDRLRVLLNSRTSSVTKSGFVESIARLTDRTDDLGREQAAGLATYLLNKKRVDEHQAILPHISKFGKWKRVRLAVADQLDEASVTPAQLQEVVTALLGREIELGEGDAGREAARVELLNDVLADAKKDDVGDQDKYQVFNDAAQSLYDFYTAQAIMYQVEEWSDEPVTPTVVAEALIGTRVKQMLEAKISPEQKTQIQQIEIDSRAVDYLASNDLQKLMLLDRLALRLLAVDVARKHPDRGLNAAALVDQLAVRDRDSKHVLLQLRDGQESVLRMWVLLNRTD